MRATLAPWLDMQGIEKRFGPVTALAGVSLAVRPGTIHALVGENGAGKSTLMKILAGAFEPDAGIIRIDGVPRRLSRPADALAAGISMIYQELTLAADLSVTENLFLGREPAGPIPGTIDFRNMVHRAQELLTDFSTAIDPMAMVRNLSPADRQMVEIVKALARDASILVMDEPTSSLSAAEAGQLLGTVRTLRNRGVSVIYISHRLEEVAQIADDLTVLRDGRVAHSGPAADVSIPEIVRHMVGRDLTEFFPPRRCQIGNIRLRVRDLATARGVEGIHLDLRAGEVVGMAGLVGAGRTEVARALFGVDRLTAGTLEIDGQAVRIASPAAAIAQGLAFLTEDRKQTGLCLGLPAAWNITLPSLEKIGMGRLIRPARERSLAGQMASQIWVRWAGPEQPTQALSGGNQQKLLIARWLLAESRVILFDEPTRGIDVAAKREVYELINRLASSGKAILVISSELEELFGISDRILVLRRGRLVGNMATRSTTPEAVMHLAAVEERT